MHLGLRSIEIKLVFGDFNIKLLEIKHNDHSWKIQMIDKHMSISYK
jgi:hypothetical protein